MSNIANSARVVKFCDLPLDFDVAAIPEPVTESESRKRRAARVADSLDRAADRLASTWLSENGVTVSDIRDSANRLRGCGDALVYSVPSKSIVSGHYCQIPALCPICGHRQQTKRAMRYSEEAKKIKGHFYHVTFTQKKNPRECLVGSLDRFRLALRRFRMKGQRRLFGSRSGGEWSKVTAAIVGIEPKVAKDGDGYHVHGHGFLVCSEPLDYRLHHNDPDYVANDGTILSKLTREWYEATENESYNVNVRWIPSRDSPEWHKAIMEVVNYTVWGAAAEINDEKTADARALDILIGTKNRRFFEAYGAFRAIDAEKQDPHAGPYVVYSYRPGSRGYVPVMATDIFPLEVERRGLQAQIGRAVGGYRGARRDLLASGLATAAGMDKIKESFRATCSDLSGRYSRRTEAMRAFIGAIVPALHGLPNAAKTIINAETWRAFYADIDPCPI